MILPTTRNTIQWTITFDPHKPLSAEQNMALITTARWIVSSLIPVVRINRK